MGSLEWKMLLLVLGLACWPLLMRQPGIHRRLWIMVVATCVVTVLGASTWTRSPGEPDRRLPEQVSTGGFVTSDACRTCHPGAHAQWHASYHRTMTQVAKVDNILFPFDNVRLNSRGRDYLLQSVEDQCWITMADPEYERLLQFQLNVDLSKFAEVPIITRPVVMLTGSHNMQGFWVSGTKGNHLHQVPWYYLLDDEQWIPREDAFLEPPGGPRSLRMWNPGCIHCHSVAGNPNLNVEQNTFNSETAELGISCEACHGPGEKHIRTHQDPLSRYRLHLSERADPTIVNPARCSTQVSAEICAQCHATMSNRESHFLHGRGYRAGGDLSQTHVIVTFEDRHDEGKRGLVERAYWKDGTGRVGGDEYNGLIASPCYQAGQMSCLSCHSMHEYSEPAKQLSPRMDGDEACLQCHDSLRDRIQEHTHHPVTSSGSRCYNCHMPFTSYALLRALRSHRVDVPDIASSVQSGRPNACNLCHLDKTLEWSAVHLSDWYGAPEVELNAQQREVAASLLWLIKGDAVQRAVAAWHMGWEPALAASGAHWQVPFLAHLLEDPYAAVRFVAGKAVRKHPGFELFKHASKDQVIQHWNAVRDVTAIRPGPQILLGPDGAILGDQLDELALERNDTPIIIPE